MAGVQHIAFNCRDREAQEAFYAKHFGFRRVRVFNTGTDGEFVMLRSGPTCLELFSAAAGQAGGGEQAVGFKHVALEVADVPAAVAALNADGIETERIIDCSSLAPGWRVCFFDDPEGNRLELIEGYQDDPAFGE